MVGVKAGRRVRGSFLGLGNVLYLGLGGNYIDIYIKKFTELNS